MTSQSLDPNQSHDVPQIELKLHHRMSWVSLSTKSPYNALRFDKASVSASYMYSQLSQKT